MASVIRSLAIELKAQTADFNNAIRDAAREMKEFEKSVRPSKELLRDIGETAAVAGLAIIGGLALAVKGAADYGDEMHDAAMRTGVTTEALSKLRLAAETSGSSFDGLTTGLKFLAKNMELANAGGKEQIKAFAAAGISAKDLAAAHGDVNKILPKLADSFAAAEDGAGKTAVSMALLGRSGTDLIPLLNEGSAGLKRWGDEAERSGRVISTEAAKAADEFNDRLHVLQVSVMGLSGTIGNALIPTLTDWVKEGTAVVQQVRAWTAENKDLASSLAGIGVFLTGTGGILVGVVALTSLLPKLQVAWTALSGAISVSTLGLAAALAGIVYFRKEIAEGLMAALATAVQGIEKFTNFAAGLADKIGAQGLANKLHDASFAAGTFRRELDAGVTSLMAEGMELGKTPALLAAEEAARVSATKATQKHRIELAANTEEIDKAKKALAEYTAFWSKAMLEFKNQTFAGGAEVKAGLDEADRAVKAIIKDYEALIKVEQDAGDEQIKNQEYWNKQLQIFRASTDSVKDAVKAGEDAADRSAKKVIENMEKQKKALQQATDDVKRSAGAIFDAMFIKGENVFTSLKNLLKGGALSLGRAIFEDVAGALLGPIKKAFDDFFIGLLEGTGLKTFLSGLGSKIGGALSGIGGSSASAAGSVASGAGSAGSAGGGASSAASGASGALGIVGIAVDALGSIGVILQLKRLEGTMNAVEANTRFTYIELKDTMDALLWPIKGILEFSADRAGEQVQQLDAIYNVLAGAPRSGVGGSVVGGSNLTIESKPVYNFNLTVAPGAKMTEAEFRDFAMPQLKSWQDNNTRSYSTNLTATVKKYWNGVVVTAT